MAVSHRIIKIILVALFVAAVLPANIAQAQIQQEGSIGVEGRISSPPPSVGATISVPRDGQTFSELPITVAGICQDGLHVRLFKNNVFAGADQCEGGSFSIIIDLFSGLNEIVARVYDDLDQAGPDSNIVRVTFNDSRPGAGSRVSLTSNFAKRGANPNETLVWPIALAGGSGPYAVTVDWGDGKPVDLLSRQFAGDFDIQHVYDNPGIYNIIVKAVDESGAVAYLQLVGVANGPLTQDTADNNQGFTESPTKVLWQPAAALIPLIALTFWLGKKYELKAIRKRLERGDRPF